MQRLVARFENRIVQLEVPRQVVHLGSGKESDLIVPFPGVSRCHLEIQPEGSGLRLTDLESKNGIVHGGERHREYLLRIGDEVRLGRAYLRFEEFSTSDNTIAVPLDGLVIEAEPGADGESRDTADSEESSGAERALVLADGMVVGSSSAMRELLERVQHCAPSQARVLLLGESGVGKELIAKTIHLSSRRSKGPYVAFNCGAIPRDLFESLLFGHERGAFTGAVSSRKGLFEAADGGTVFLDEIGEVPLESQVKLLRALQEGEVLRVGSTRSHPVDVRVIAASNRDLEEQVASGTLRADLYYRLAVVALTIPPLRDCKEDIPGLAGAFAEKFARREGKRIRGISQKTLAELVAYDWPGNVRELENEMEGAVLMCSDGGSIESRHLAGALRDVHSGSREMMTSGNEGAVLSPRGGHGFSSWEERLRRLKREAVRDALVVAGGTKLRAARLLGVSRGTLDKWITEFATKRNG